MPHAAKVRKVDGIDVNPKDVIFILDGGRCKVDEPKNPKEIQWSLDALHQITSDIFCVTLDILPRSPV